MRRVLVLFAVCCAVVASDEAPSPSATRSARKRRASVTQGASAPNDANNNLDSTATHSVTGAGPNVARSLEGKRKLFHVPAVNEATATQASQHGDVDVAAALLKHVHDHARGLASSVAAGEDVESLSVQQRALARAGLDASGELIHGIPRSMLARGKHMLPNLAKNTSCDAPCSGGGCIYVDCAEPVECRGGSCIFYRCDNPRCGGGACKFLECVYPSCAGGACDFVETVTPLDALMEFCAGGGCTYEGAEHVGLPAGDAVY